MDVDFPVVRITPLIRTTVVPISGVIGTTVVRIASVALGGPILSGIGLSGSDRDERDSNLLDISREAVVSNNEVEKFGIVCKHDLKRLHK